MKANLVKIENQKHLFIPSLALSSSMTSLELARQTFSSGVDQEIIALISLAHSGDSLDYDHRLLNKIVLMSRDSRMLASVNLGKSNKRQDIVMQEIQQASNVFCFRASDFYESKLHTNDQLDVSLTFRRIVYFVRAYPELFLVQGQISLFPLFGLPAVRLIKVVKKDKGLFVSMYSENEQIPVPWNINYKHRIFQVESIS